MFVQSQGIENINSDFDANRASQLIPWEPVIGEFRRDGIERLSFRATRKPHNLSCTSSSP